MGLPSDTVVEKQRNRIAADYRRRGYRVTRPEGPTTLPSFLRDCHPDLIAERDDDRVVIEVKPSRTLKGSNDLHELAARVATQPGWRLELVALGSDGEEAVAVSRPDWLETMLQRYDLAADPGLAPLNLVYFGEVLRYLLRGLAVLNGVGIRDKSAERIARELAFAGVIDQDILDRIEGTFDWRNSLMHDRLAPPQHVDQATELVALCREIHAACLSVARKREV